MITNISSYNYDVSIPRDDLVGQGSDLPNQLEQYEKEALKDLFGDELYEAFIEDQAQQRFQVLLSGDNFSFDFEGNTINGLFIGLQDNRSLLVYYNYYRWMYDRFYFSTPVGAIRPNNENSSRANYDYVLRGAFNNYIQLAGIIPDYFIDQHGAYRSGYPILKNDNSTYIHLDDRSSLYNFMLANIADYPEWKYNPKNKTKKHVFNL